MSGIKTGNKGFVNPVDGKVYTVDSVAPGADGVNDAPPLPDPGNMTVDNNVKDIGKITRVTLGTYLSKMTKGEVGPAKKSNAYTIDASNNSTPQSSITTPAGYPVPLAPSNNTSQFKQVLPSSISDDYSVVASDIKKGSAPGTGVDGNKLLRGATVNDSSTQLVSGGPVDKYTAEVLVANRWDPSSEFTEGVDPSAVPNNFDVFLQSVATAVLPSSEATDPSNAQYQLDLGKAASVGPKKTENNDFPVPPNPNDALQLVAITTSEAPSPLTPQQGAPVFAPNIGNSYTNDYTELNVNAQDGLQKGSTSVGGPNGNEFLSKTTLSAGQINSPTPLVNYTAAAITPNVRSVGGSGFSQGEDISNPSPTFNPSLQSVATMVPPSGEAIAPAVAQYNLDLNEATKKPADDTVKNAYPVSKPGLGQNLENLAKLTTEEIPSPLTPASTANLYVHAPNLQPSESDVFIAHGAGINKGKSNDLGSDGNSLLSSDIQQNSQGVVDLPGSLETYTTHVTEQNDQSPSNPLVPSEIDPTAPPAGYHPYLADVSTLGSHTGAPHDQLTLDELRVIGSTKTQDAKNDYPVDKNLAALSAVTEIDGYPAPLADTGNSKKFAERSEIAPVPNETIKFNKGKGNGEWNGNTILKDVSGNLYIAPAPGSRGDVLPGGSAIEDKTSPNNPIKEYKIDDHKRSSGKVSPFALGNSRFISKSQFVYDSQPIPEFNPIIYQHGIVEKRGVSTLKMAKIGVGLSQRASTEIPGWPGGPGKDGQFDPTNSAAEAGALLPSVSQLGILKVNNNLLSAKDVLDSIIDAPDYDPDALVEIAPFGGQSWGNLNNISEPFSDGANSVGLFLTMLALVIAIVVLFSVIALIVPNGKRSATSAPSGERTLGKYLFADPEKSWPSFLPDPAEIFGIKQTINPFDSSLLAGTYSFFLGAENADASIVDLIIGLATSGLDQLLKDNNSVGANVVVCRTIIRSGLVMAEQISNVIKKVQLSPVAGAKSAVNLLRAFRSSKLISAINVFSALGDQLLNSRIQTAKVIGPDGKEMTVDLSNAASADQLMHSTVRKHRLTTFVSDVGLLNPETANKTAAKQYDPTLAWSSQRAPSMYLLPPSITNLQLNDAANILGSFKGVSALDTDKAVIAAQRVNNRISDADRKLFEARLEAEYVPFYFHDVRTNEIISFHAFLASMGDSFNVSYDTVESFGRVEPIKIYKSTTRKIDMSFYLVSTSVTDFDHMWHKINKLTTMIYPQYTKGRLLTADKTQLRAPFSQLVGASPLIRIRLGDLFKSNYSRFALARLFGAGDGDMSVPDVNNKQVDVKFNTLDPKDLNGKLSKFNERKINPVVGDTGFLQSNPANAIEITKIIDAVTFEYKERKENGKEGVKNTSRFIPDADTTQKIVSEIFGSESAYTALTQFMNPTGNAIVKSFETAGGKGLAGFIDNLAFDWYDKVTWEIDPGRTAPKMCKITISFSPVHDITPGIDHLGYNRAPIYGVGAAMNSTPAASIAPGR
jgi:hypothetical protein